MRWNEQRDIVPTVCPAMARSAKPVDGKCAAVLRLHGPGVVDIELAVKLRDIVRRHAEIAKETNELRLRLLNAGRPPAGTLHNLQERFSTGAQHERDRQA
jgi:hypothetical protein